LSLSGATALGRALGWVWFNVVRIRRRTAIRQIRAAFPEWESGRARRVARELYLDLGRWAVEFLRFVGRDDHRRELLARVRVEGLERYESAVAAGRGVIVATAHLGNWDLAACAQGVSGRPLVLLSRSLSNRGLDRFWMERRRGTGLEILDESSAVSVLAGVLRSGRSLALLIDQATPPERGGILIDFLGRPAWTTRLPALLSERTGAPIVPVFAESPAFGGHVIHVEPPLSASEVSSFLGGEGAAARIAAATRALSARLERRVRANPGQWLWLHRRWKAFGRGRG
jgi:KDO2-lipid IV(A) lauroyltransferase